MQTAIFELCHEVLTTEVGCVRLQNERESIERSKPMQIQFVDYDHQDEWINKAKSECGSQEGRATRHEYGRQDVRAEDKRDQCGSQQLRATELEHSRKEMRNKLLPNQESRCGSKKVRANDTKYRLLQYSRDEVRSVKPFRRSWKE